MNKGKLLNTTPAHLKKDNPFLCEVDSLSLSNTQLNLNMSCRLLFAKGRKPKFRAKGKDKRSYTTNWTNNNIEIVHKGDTENYIKLPKLGRVRIILHRGIPDEWRMKHATIKETASGKFYVSLTFDVDTEPMEKRKKFDRLEAFDYSMPSLVVSASGENDITSDDIRWYRNIEERIAKEQRKLSRMQYGSRNYWEQKHRIGKLHEKARNRRKDFLHKLSRKVSDAFDAVVVEDINLRHMSQSLNFGKSVYDNGYGMLRNMLAYKLKDKGKVLVKVDKFFPSSKRCSSCHEINRDLKLSDREWTCSNCGMHHDRDRNATKNLQDEGKDILNRWTNGDSSLILAPSGVLSEKKLHPQTHSNVRQGGE
ncbi:MAG TPA: transposase [Candidatus Ornithospirochaeta stercorigallinarum]|nr:transposase [Candidatus Ornithospirochaeta stercorigallinarum]